MGKFFLKEMNRNRNTLNSLTLSHCIVKRGEGTHRLDQKWRGQFYREKKIYFPKNGFCIVV